MSPITVIKRRIAWGNEVFKKKENYSKKPKSRSEDKNNKKPSIEREI